MQKAGYQQSSFPVCKDSLVSKFASHYPRPSMKQLQIATTVYEAQTEDKPKRAFYSGQLTAVAGTGSLSFIISLDMVA
jgi:hypothetical protein